MPSGVLGMRALSRKGTAHAPPAAPRPRAARLRRVVPSGAGGGRPADRPHRHRAGGGHAGRARQRLFPGQLHPNHRLAAQGRRRERPHQARLHRQDGGRSRPVDGDRLRAGQHRQPGAPPPGSPPARTGQGRGRGAGARARPRRQGDGVDRRGHPRDGGGEPAGAPADDPRPADPERPRNAAPAGRRRHAVRVGEPGRGGAGRRLVHAPGRPGQAHHGHHPPPLPEVCRPRRQPRQLRRDPGRDRQHQPRGLPHLVPADPLQPAPDRAGGHGGVHSPVPRSVQLQQRAAGDQRGRRARPPHARAAGRAEHGRFGDALGCALLHLVQRQPAHHRLFPQPGRHPYGDHRQSDAHENPAHPAQPAAARGRGDADPARRMASPAVDRLCEADGPR